MFSKTETMLFVVIGALIGLLGGIHGGLFILLAVPLLMIAAK